MSEAIIEGWITTDEAETLSGYSRAYLRRLANRSRVEARRIGRDWLINRESLLAYKAEMERLGPAKHNPWRESLGKRGRGRQNEADRG